MGGSRHVAEITGGSNPLKGDLRTIVNHMVNISKH